MGKRTSPALRFPGLRRARTQGGAAYREVSRALDRMAEIDDRRGDDHEQTRRLRKEMAAELGPIRAHLAARPEDEQRLREDVHERGLADRFPWRRLNRGTARDLAVLYCFTPY